MFLNLLAIIGIMFMTSLLSIAIWFAILNTWLVNKKIRKMEEENGKNY